MNQREVVLREGEGIVRLVRIQMGAARVRQHEVGPKLSPHLLRRRPIALDESHEPACNLRLGHSLGRKLWIVAEKRS